jgi:hypothetical protein
MRTCGDGLYGLGARGPIVVLWRAGLRMQEALDLSELGLDPRRGSVLIRRRKGGHRREVARGTIGRSPHRPPIASASASNRHRGALGLRRGPQ